MQMKILGAVALATGLVLAGCSGGDNGSSGSTGGTTTAGTTGQTSSGNTTGQSTTGATTGQSTTGATTGQSTTGATTGQSTTGSTTGQSTTGSTTGTTSGEGVTDTDCGPNHAACNPGQHCDLYGYPPQIPMFHACGCDQYSDGGLQADQTEGSCAENDDPNSPSAGKIICDQITFDCRKAADFEPAAVNSIPALADGGGTLGDGGYDLSNACASGGYEFFNDGQGGYLCLQVGCTSTNDCLGGQEYCHFGGLTDPQTGADAGSYCDQNLCGPDLTAGVPLDDGGFEQDDAGNFVQQPDPRGQYYVGCDVNGANDTGDGGFDLGGTCEPLPNNAGTGYVGICYRNGTQTEGQACSGFFGPFANSCSEGMICLGSGFPPGTLYQGHDISAPGCYVTCNANISGGPQAGCPTTSTGTETCTPFPVDPAGVDLQTGYCHQ